jgi:hypothetical protein
MSIPLPLLQQREIEAKAIAPLFQAFVAEVGEQRARDILRGAIGQLAQQAGCSAAITMGGNDLRCLKLLVEKWQENGALELTVLRDDSEGFEFNVTRCQFAEMYRRLGLADLGPVLSCGRDGALIEGFNPEIAFSRTQTIMEGAAFCNFRYKLSRTPPTPLLAALWDGDREAALKLIVAGADVNAVDSRPVIGHGVSPLHIAAANDDPVLVRALLAAGAAVDARSLAGQTPLWWACNSGRLASARELLEAGADPNARCNEGYSPLGRTQYSCVELQALLRAHRAVV